MRFVFFPINGYSGDGFFKLNPDRWHLPFVLLKDLLCELGHEVQVYPCEANKETDFGIYFCMPQYPAPLTHKSILIELEPPVVSPRVYERINGLPFTKILTFAKEYCGHNKINYLPFPLIRHNKPIVTGNRVHKICAIYGNKSFNNPGELYTARRQQILSWGKEIHLYGNGWQNDREIIENVIWYGPWLGNKIDLLSKYVYTVNYENMDIEGYASEKWGDAIQAGCVPIRRGWEPDYQIEYAFEDNWIKLVYQHIKQLI